LRFQASVLERISDAVIDVDTAERVSYLSAAACRLYGVAPERALAAGFDHYLTKPVNHETVLSLLRQAQP
jgi:PAS domain-containing protein